MSEPGSAAGGRDALSYEAALRSLDAALAFGIEPSLTGIRALTGELGSPQDAFASVQVTGTNGKTSVTRAAAALLTAHGRRTGVYTSPHLVDYTERMAIDGEPVSRELFARAIGAALGASDALAAHQAETLGVEAGMLGAAFTEFELLTAAALWLFAERRCSWACLEVGMGGRWDSTSVVGPRVAVITGVGLDHTERLGATREAIAADKSCIIKPGSLAIMGPGCGGVQDIVLARAREVGAPLVRVAPVDAEVTWRVTGTPDAPGGMLRLDVCGRFAAYDALEVLAPSYQAPNIACAVAAAEAALGGPLDLAAVRDALRALRFPGRFELLEDDPPLLIDGAHNPQAAGVLATAIAEAFSERKPTIVLGVLADKDAEGIVRALAPQAAAFVVTRNVSPRALACEDLAVVVERVTGATPLAEPDLATAVRLARERSAAGVVVTGSLYTAGELRGHWLERGGRRAAR